MALPGDLDISPPMKLTVKRLFLMGHDVDINVAVLAGEKLAQQVSSPYINSPLSCINTAVGWDIIYPGSFDMNLDQMRLQLMPALSAETLSRVIKETTPALLCTSKRSNSQFFVVYISVFWYPISTRSDIILVPFRFIMCFIQQS